MKKTTSKKLTRKNMLAYVKGLRVPEGWTWEEVLPGQMEPGGWFPVPSLADEYSHLGVFALCSPVPAEGISQVVMIFRFQRFSGWVSSGQSKVGYSGTTLYLVPGKGTCYYSFDRTGVEDSFYGTDETDINELVAKQQARIQASIERIGRSVAVPGLPFSVTPERQAELSNRLNTQGVVSLTPSGFGTGYMLHKKAPRSTRYFKEGSKELAQFFGLPAIWITTFDHD